MLKYLIIKSTLTKISRLKTRRFLSLVSQQIAFTEIVQLSSHTSRKKMKILMTKCHDTLQTWRKKREIRKSVREENNNSKPP